MMLLASTSALGTIIFIVSALFLALPVAAESETVESVQPEGFYLDVDEVSISTGHFHTCALELRPGVDFGGPVKCWGYNDRGQASPPSGILIQVSCGLRHTCGITSDETVSCWGDFTSPPDGLYTQVSSGESHACALSKDGTLKCWGRNDFGESSPPEGHFVQVTCGQAISCGLRRTGMVECWGKNHLSQNSPPSNTTFKQISASIDHHVCGIAKDGDIICWGNNNRAQSQLQKGKVLWRHPIFMCKILSTIQIDC